MKAAEIPMLPESIFGRAFQTLPDCVSPHDAAEPTVLLTALTRMMGSPEARHATGPGVAVWALDCPYTHRDGNKLKSGIIYIEKYVRSLSARWPRRYLSWLCTDEGHGGEPSDRACLRELAALDHNWSFYSTVVKTFGPLRVWYASTTALNAQGGQTFAGHREWEFYFNTKYRNAHGCLPLKNRRP